MFNNGEITFYNDGWKIVFELYKLELADVQEIHDQIFEVGYGSFNWKAFRYGDLLWYADGSKSVRAIRKNNDTKTIWFGK